MVMPEVPVVLHDEIHEYFALVTNQGGLGKYNPFEL